MAAPLSNSARLTIPNLITLARILLVPIFLICLIQGNYRRALIIFLVAGLSDLADGLVARMWQQKSPLGAILDPLADKLLMSTSFIALAVLRLIPPWLTVVVLTRDVIILVGVVILKLVEAPLVVQPSLAGKLTTWMQIGTVLLVLAGKVWKLPPPLLTWFFWATALFTVISGLQYMGRGLRMVQQSAAVRGQGDDHG